MIKITPHPIVLERLRDAFPTPPNSASKALQKYTTLLEELLTEAMTLRRSPYDRKLNLYSILVNDLAHKGPRIGTLKTRLHKWLNDNDLALIEIVVVGNNINGEKSKIRVTSNATITDVFAIEDADTDSFRLLYDRHLTDTNKIASVASYHYPDFSIEKWNAGELRDLYDVVRVNRDSVERYLSWVLNKTYKISAAKRDEYARHAQFVLTIADFYDGIFPQRRIKSDFGRTYYAGISIQNVNKMLRQAIVAPAFEYDINTCVCAWKLGIAYSEMIRVGKQAERAATVEKKHLALCHYVQNKKEFISFVRMEIFPNTDKNEHEEQRRLIKSALTALSFGATLKTKGWQDASGQREYPALKTIFRRHPDALDRFVNHAVIINFVKDQKEIDDWLFALFNDEKPFPEVPSYFKTRRGRLSQSKVIAWFYQQSETMIMNSLRKFLETQTPRKVIANIHDAIILDGPLGHEMKIDLTDHLQQKHENPYITLKKIELVPFTNETQSELTERMAHKQRIALESAAAAKARQ